MRAVLAALVIAVSAAAAPAAGWTQEPRRNDPRAQAEEMLRQATDKLLLALELMIQAIPQYEMPEITEDGDIIIRRKRPGEIEPREEDGLRRI